MAGCLGEDILFSEIEKQIHEDGVYFEQSTWYHRYTVDIYSQFMILKSLDTAACEALDRCVRIAVPKRA